MSSGDVGYPAGVPIGNFSFNATSGTLLGPGTFSLGTFVASPLPEGAGLTYNNLPFYITVWFNSQGPINFSTSSELSIRGVLNGTVTGSMSSNVVATVTSMQSFGPDPLPFSLDSFNVLTPQTLAPSGINGGNTAFMAQLNAIPEPGPLAMMGLLAGWAVLRLSLRRVRSGVPTRG
jgi:hypothetical protein